MSAGADGAPAGLLDWLRGATGAAGLGYAEPPRRIHGGNETRIFGFRLRDAPPPFDGPLILRLFPAGVEAESVRLEGAMQNALADQGFPAARVFATVTGLSALGGAFLLMARLPGRPMLADLMLPDEAGVPRGSTARLLARVPGLLAAIPHRFVEVTRRLQAVDAGSFLRTLESAALPVERLTLDWRLAELRRRVEEGRFEELRPGLDWALERRPAPDGTVLCHGDLQPLNILEEGGRLSGVVDWTHLLAAEPAFEVGWTRTTYLTVPLAAPLVPFARWVAARYRRLAARERGLDPAAVRYYEALRCLHVLALHAESLKAGRPYVHAWNSPRGLANLAAHFRSVTGLTLPWRG